MISNRNSIQWESKQRRLYREGKLSKRKIRELEKIPGWEWSYSTSSECLAISNPELVREWHPIKNDQLTVFDVTAGSNKKVWWRADCGHEWRSSINNRCLGRGCPICKGAVVDISNCLQTLFPDISKEWHPTKNGKLKSSDVRPKSHRKVWWKGKCGHEWQAVVGNRTGPGSGCPICSRYYASEETSLARSHPTIASEWNFIKNGDLFPTKVLSGSNRKVWWKGKCGHEWLQSPKDRTCQKQGCPYCSGNRLLLEKSLGFKCPEIAKEWHESKNKMNSFEISYASHRKVWWKGTCGHEWEAVVKNRAIGNTGCLICWRNRGKK